MQIAYNEPGVKRTGECNAILAANTIFADFEIALLNFRMVVTDHPDASQRICELIDRLQQDLPNIESGQWPFMALNSRIETSLFVFVIGGKADLNFEPSYVC